MTWRLRNNQELNIMLRLVEHLMWNTGRDFRPFMRAQGFTLAVKLDRRRAEQDKEELSRCSMIVTHF
jgi:hypothetical protein